MIAQYRPDIARVAEETVVNLKELENRIEILKNDLTSLCMNLGHPEAARIAATPARWIGPGALQNLAQTSPFGLGASIPYGIGTPFQQQGVVSPFQGQFGIGPFQSPGGFSPFVPQSAGYPSPFGVSPFGTVGPVGLPALPAASVFQAGFGVVPTGAYGAPFATPFSPFGLR